MRKRGTDSDALIITIHYISPFIEVRGEVMKIRFESRVFKGQTVPSEARVLRKDASKTFGLISRLVSKE